MISSIAKAIIGILMDLCIRENITMGQRKGKAFSKLLMGLYRFGT